MAEEFVLVPGRCGLQPAAGSGGVQGILALGALFLAGGCPSQGTLMRRAVLMGAGLGLGKAQGPEDQKQN